MGLASERVVTSAPMSFSGSARRSINMLWRDKHPAFKWLVGLWAVPLLIGIWWIAVAGWYLLFGLLVVPWRLLRRGSRKRRRDEARHREILDATRQSAGNQSP